MVSFVGPFNLLAYPVVFFSNYFLKHCNCPFGAEHLGSVNSLLRGTLFGNIPVIFRVVFYGNILVMLVGKTR